VQREKAAEKTTDPGSDKTEHKQDGKDDERQKNELAREAAEGGQREKDWTVGRQAVSFRLIPAMAAPGGVNRAQKDGWRGCVAARPGAAWTALRWDSTGESREDFVFSFVEPPILVGQVTVRRANASHVDGLGVRR
jgi:hypothetical protein